MSDKSYVTLEQQACIVCGKPYDTGALLLDRRLREKFDQKTITGMGGLCPEHKQLYDEGYVALVSIDESKSEKLSNGSFAPAKVYRTGTVAHVRVAVYDKLFNVPIPKDADGKPGALVFCDSLVIDHLQKLSAEAKS